MQATQMVNRLVLPMKGVHSIEMDYRGDSIQLVPCEAHEIVLEEYMPQRDPLALAGVANDGTTLRIRQGERRFLQMGMLVSHAVLHIPTAWVGTLRVTTKSGSVQAEGDLTLESLRIGSKSGDVSLQKIHAEGEIYLKTASGSIRCAGLQTPAGVRLQAGSGAIRPGVVRAGSIGVRCASGHVEFAGAWADATEVRNGSGDIRFGRLEGHFTLRSKSGAICAQKVAGNGGAQSTSGGIQLSLELADGDLAVESTSGNVRLQLPKGMEFSFEGSTTLGRIKTDFDRALQYGARRVRARGNHGAHPAFAVACKTTSGNLRAEWL